MDKAPAYGAGDCRFESCLSQKFFILDIYNVERGEIRWSAFAHGTVY